MFSYSVVSCYHKILAKAWVLPWYYSGMIGELKQINDRTQLQHLIHLLNIFATYEASSHNSRRFDFKMTKYCVLQ